MNNDILKQISELEKQIGTYPIGTIAQKKIRNKIYYYHRFNESGKRKEKYIPESEINAFREQIAQRKELELKLNELKKRIPHAKPAPDTYTFVTDVRIGNVLRLSLESVRGYKKRSLYQQLHDYIYGKSFDHVFILFGLRRTGKTTLIRQIIADMDDEDFAKTAFIQTTTNNTLADVNKDLKYLENKGYKYIFIDEVTLMPDFIEGAALFSDIYAACGMKIVLSGTDSLGFLLSESDQLYDRYYQAHTTHIPYREFEEVLGIKGIDEYIRYGGTMSLSGVHYNESSTFATKENVDRYIDSAIAKNIQHSLQNYQYENHFRNLRDLYEHNELTNAINRVVENINQAFLLKVLTDDFKSHDFGRSLTNLRGSGNFILDDVDRKSLTDRLKQTMNILNKPELSVPLNDVHLREITQYLLRLEMLFKIIERSDQSNENNYRLVIAQPGLRYAQANALAEALIKDVTFSKLDFNEQAAVLERIDNEIKGRMMEDIVLLETQLSDPQKEVFALHFDIGEFDMVIYDPKASSCSIYEIKHSSETAPAQYKHLIDNEKRETTAFRFGPITDKCVIYRGESCNVDGIRYLNVEEYLKGLG